MFVGAVALYLRTTRSRDRVGTIAWWALIALLLALYVPAPWSPPPRSENTVAIAGLIALAMSPAIATVFSLRGGGDHGAGTYSARSSAISAHHAIVPTRSLLRVVR